MRLAHQIHFISYSYVFSLFLAFLLYCKNSNTRITIMHRCENISPKYIVKVLNCFEMHSFTNKTYP